jgi:hypothetical protein
MHTIWSDNLRQRDHLGDTCLSGRTTLKIDLKEMVCEPDLSGS